MGEEERELYARVAVLGEVLQTIQRDLAEITTQIEGPPWERSVRGRLEILEAEAQQAKAASGALVAAQQDLRRARAEREQAERFAWSWRWKLIAAMTAAFVAAAPYVTMFYRPGR